jgi:hypothetical protein
MQMSCQSTGQLKITRTASITAYAILQSSGQRAAHRKSKIPAHQEASLPELLHDPHTCCTTISINDDNKDDGWRDFPAYAFLRALTGR